MEKKTYTLVISVAIYALFSQISFPQANQLDATFGHGGIVTTAMNVFGNSGLNAAVEQSDGKIVAVGTYYNLDNYDFALTRFNQDGSQDHTFGINGIVITDLSGYKDEAFSVALQSNGKIVAAGYSNDRKNFALIRYNTDGSVDSTFGSNGISAFNFSSFNNEAHSLTFQNDGKIIVTGYSDNGSNYDFALARLTEHGNLDNDFGTNGKVVTTLISGNEMAHTVVVQKDGKIVAAGLYNLVRYTENGSLDNTFGSGGIASQNAVLGKTMVIRNDGKFIVGGNDGSYFSLACYNENGIRDSTFGTNGSVSTPIGLGSEINFLGIRGDGKIIAAGNAYFEASTYYLALACYKNNGDIDTDFGTNGFVTRQIGTWSNNISSAVIKADGKIIVAGSTNYGNGGYQHFNLSGFTANGSVDHTYATDGNASGEIGKTNSGINSIAIQSDGKIIVAGKTNTSPTEVNNTDMVIGRYNTNGILDNTFGINGIVNAQMGGTDEQVNCVAIQNDGKIVTAGYSGNGNSSDFVLTRYLSNGIPDNTFGISGIVLTPIGSAGDARARSVIIQPDGKIITAGYSRDIVSDADFTLARYNTNGSLDNSFGLNGIVNAPIDIYIDFAYAVTLQKDGKIIAAGGSFTENQYQFVLARFKSNGRLDSAFGTNGRVITPVGYFGYAFSTVIQPDDKIIAAGISNNGVALIRYNTDGTLDSLFGTNGIVTTQVHERALAYSSALQSDGKIIVAGFAETLYQRLNALIRYNTDGTPDNTFGTDGILLTPIGLIAEVRSIAIQSDGNIVAGGSLANENGYSAFCLVRYNVSEVTGIDENHTGKDENSPLLEQNYPNPFRISTKIKYQVPESGFVTLKIYDLTGREINSLVNETKSKGSYEVEYNPSELAGGVYLYRLTSGTIAVTRKMIISK